jgi:uncharacterized protein
VSIGIGSAGVPKKRGGCRRRQSPEEAAGTCRKSGNRRFATPPPVAESPIAGRLLGRRWIMGEGEFSGDGIPRRLLGRTGVEVSILGLGGHHVGSVEDEREAVSLVREAVDSGVTFLDNAWEYHHGRSEELYGKALQGGYRDRCFLMTKHHGRDRKTALRHLEESLRRLRTDVIDLWQFHEIIYDDDPDMIFAPGGGIEAAYEAKREGKVRFIGFTGHKDPALFRRMLAHDFPWDTVQMPVNVLDPHFRSFIREILPILTEREIGPIAMKTMSGGNLPEAGVVSTEEALRFVWSLPVSTAVLGMKSRETLRENIGYARRFVPLSPEEDAALLHRTHEAGARGEFELFKTSDHHDGWPGRELHGLPGG